MIRRSKPLKRNGLKRPTVEQVRAWQSKPRKAIAKIGRKAKRERAALDKFRAKVRAHAAGYCEVAGIDYELTPHAGATFTAPICGTSRSHHGHNAHHVWPEDHDAGRHDERRGLWVCARAHDWIHTNPWQAGELGLLRPGNGKLSTPVDNGVR